MTIQEAIELQKISMYKIAKLSGLPYTTVREICTGKTKLENCNVMTVYKIASALGLTVEEVLEPCLNIRSSFENFKSTTCQRLKELGDIDFIMDTLENQMIRTYYERKWFPECLYLLAMLDYISRVNDVPLCNDYDDIRSCKLENPIYPTSLQTYIKVTNDSDALTKALNNAIPEFKRFNIIENEVRNVC